MSNIDKMLESTSTNQYLFVDLNEKDAETVSGGLAFTIRNETDNRIPYAVDGTQTNRPYGGSVSNWTTGEGKIDFDYDFGLEGVQSRKYSLADGHTYAFRYDNNTGYDKDIDLYDIT
ncbi:hypothetical protein [Nostoc sp.]|uniref:hypothetical protein n=1 Tax=Nostoc sp. TaxID=1180 RepID=UPI002FF92C31